MDLITGPVVAVMFHISFGFFGSQDETYVASYRDLETCRTRIEEMDKQYQNFYDVHYYKKHRYCRLEAVVQK